MAGEKKKGKKRVEEEGWQRDRKMKKMSEKEMEKGYKDGGRESLMKDEGGVDGVRHREVKAQQVRGKERAGGETQRRTEL